MKTIASIYTPNKEFEKRLVEFIVNPTPCDNLYSVVEAVGVISKTIYNRDVILTWNSEDNISSTIQMSLDNSHSERERMFREGKL